MSLDLEVLSFIRDQMLSYPNINAEFVWKVYNYGCYNGDVAELMERWMLHEDNEQQRILCERLMLEMIDFYEIVK